MLEIACEGVFRVQPLEWGIEEGKKDSSAVAIVIKAQILEGYNPEDKAWVDWRPYPPHEITGFFYIFKRDGEPNQAQIQAVQNATGWDGRFSSLAPDSGFVMQECQFTVNAEEYQGKTRFKANWINPYDAAPERSTGTNKPDKLRDLDNRLGAKLRAVSGNVTRNATPPAGTMPPRTNGATPAQQAQPANMPPRRPPMQPAQQAEESAPVAVGQQAVDNDEDLPF